MNQSETTPNNRDAVTLKILGVFFIVIGALVLIGTFWALGNFKAVVVNLTSGFVLLAVGAMMTFVAKRLKSEDTTVDDGPNR